MPTKPSDATKARSLRRELTLTQKALAEAREAATNYRVRASKAETDAAEWRRRFDVLLETRPTAGASAQQVKP